MANTGTISKREKLAIEIVSGASIREAARKFGISDRTAYRIVHQPETQKRINELRDAATFNIVHKLGARASEAVDVIAELMRNASSTTDSVKLNAAKAILQQLIPMSEHQELRKRIEALEAGSSAK